MESYIFIAIIIICVVIFVISFIRHKMDFIVNFILRIVTGVVGIYFLNMILENRGIQLFVGINGLSVLSVGLLGLPGFILNYSIAFYYMIRG